MADTSPAWAPPESDFQASATNNWSPPESDFQAAAPETAGRVSSLTGRALASGAAGLAALPDSLLVNPASAITTPIRNFIEDKLGVAGNEDTTKPYEPKLSDFIHPDKWQDAVNFLADKAGLAKPATPGERVYSKAVEAVPSAALAPEAPIMGAISSAAGGAASQATAEAGGGPVAQTLAGLAVGSVPALAANSGAIARSVLGGDSAATVAARNAAATESGTTLTAGQASGSKLLQKVQSTSGSLWGGGAVDAKVAAQNSGLSSRVSNIVDNLAQGGDVSPTGAGEAINAGGAAAKANMKAAEKAAYDKVDSLVPANAPVDVSGTLSKLDELATPPPGASNTAGALISPKIAAMRDNLKADIAANGGSPTLPYDAATKLRTAVGNSIDWGFAPSDPVTNGALKLVHGALKGDIDTSASAISPEAGQAVTDARTLYAQNQERRDALNSVIDKSGGPEAVYQSAVNGTKLGATKVAGVMNEIDEGQKNLVRATVIDRLGRSVPSAQNATGSAFDAGTFLTNWGKLAPEAKDALFGASGTPKSLRASLDSIADTMDTLKSSNALKNPSGTAKAGMHSWGPWAMLSEAATAAMMGHYKTAGATVGGGLAVTAGNALLSRALVNPRTARWLAQTAKSNRQPDGVLADAPIF